MKASPVRDLMAEGVAKGVFPGGVLLWAKGHEILFHEAFGLADLGTGKPVRPDAVFDLASLTKPLATAAAACLLVQERRLSLDTRLKDVLNGADDTPKADITIDMLLRHCAGLPAHREYFRIMAGRKDPKARLRAAILAEPLVAVPGREQVYSDLGYMLLSWVIETVAGQRLDRFVRENLYDPLGVRDMFFIDLKKNTVPVDSERLVPTSDCPWRGRMMRGEVEDENAWAAGGIEGHAGLFGDARSVYGVCLEMLNSLLGKETKVLDPDVLGCFVKKRDNRDLVAGFDTPARQNSSAGRYFPGTAVGHLGFTGTSFWINPETGLMVILLTNRVHPTRSNEKIKAFRPRLHDCIFACFT